MTYASDATPQLADVFSLPQQTPDFINAANDTVQRLKAGIKAINELSTPAARTAAQISLRD